MKDKIWIIPVLFVVVLGVIFWWSKGDNNPTITNFQECADAGNPVQESYPPRCVANGRTFVQYIGNVLEKADLITLDSVVPNQKITSPLEVSGQAVGSWFFEASFPVELKDSSGATIAQAVAQAQSDWMTTDFVPFTVTLSFSTPAVANGTLILHRDNPSGESQNEDQLVVPVVF